jgi:hypothetical protein
MSSAVGVDVLGALDQLREGQQAVARLLVQGVVDLQKERPIRLDYQRLAVGGEHIIKLYYHI